MTDLWFLQLCNQIPQGKSADLRHWAFICYVLQKAKQFQAVTAILQRHFDVSMDTNEVPLPAAFDAKLQETCQNARSRCAKSLRTLVCDYEDTTQSQCHRGLSECDDLSLGSLVRALNAAGLSTSAVETSGFTIDVLLRKLAVLRVRSYCSLTGDLDVSWTTTSRKKSYKAGMKASGCGCSDRLLAISQQLEVDVSGSPAIWSPPAHRRKLEPDSEEVFIDQNAARYGAFPMEPMLRALFEMHPDHNVDDVDVIICRNPMGKLFDFINANSKPFEMDVEMIGDKVVFLRKEVNVTEVINEFRGFGHTFPDEFTRWDSEVRGSSSHHRIVKYELAGWRYLVCCESDAYLIEKAGVLGEAPSPRTRGNSDLASAIAELSSGDMMTIDEKRTKTGQDLVIRSRGREIGQEAVVEIKTRAAHRVLDMESVLPRLWISQTPNLVAGYHKGGRFEDVQVLDVRKDLDEWEEARNSVNLRKLNSLLRQIVDTVQNTIAMKCRVRRASSGGLQIWELHIDRPSVLPDDLCLKLRGERDGHQA
ncbi:MAG: hypothetical protein M1816_001850 [Peltula sp. TS41687]|nr:MAG: hypothetical protein M1816_001850 [Peltula sp. TS41687]